jgi:inner membrane protein
VDNPTHLATGYFLSRAGLDRFTPYATAILLISANIPDIDVVSAAGGWLSYLHWHRHLTHSLLLSPVLALVSVALVWLFVRRPLPWLRATAIAWLGVLSHLFLDWTNSYGIRLLLPFSPKWYRLDIATLFDLWIYAAFALCLLAPLLAKLVGGEIGSRSRAPKRGWAIFALLFLGVYMAARGVMHGRMIDILNSRVYGGEEPVQVAVFPEAASPMRWTGLVETSGACRFYRMNALSAAFFPDAAQPLFKPEMSPAIEAARKTRPFEELLRFDQFPLWQVTPSAKIDNGTDVELLDLRLPFRSIALIDSGNRVVRSEFRVR